MFNLEDFKHSEILYPIVEKLNKYFEKGKVSKIENILVKFKDFLNQDNSILPTTYILSIIAEEHPKLISKDILKRIEELVNSDNPKIKVNSLITLGFKMISNKNFIDNYIKNFFQNIEEKENDIGENVYFFLHRVYNDNPTLFCTYKTKIIETLKAEKNKDNIVSLIDFLSECKEFTFEELYDLKKTCQEILEIYYDSNSKIISKLKNLIIRLFPSLNQDDFWNTDLNTLIRAFNDYVVAKKYIINEKNGQSGPTLKGLIEEIKNSLYIKKKLYFYVKQDENSNLINLYEIEREKLLDLFQKEDKLSKKYLMKTLEDIVKSESELRLFIETLIKFNHISGYYSLLGYYYPNNYIRMNIISKIKKKGVINLTKFDYLPDDFIKKILKSIIASENITLLMGKDEKKYYSLKKIKEKINTEAAKKNSIDLKVYRERLAENDFITLIKNLPQDYLTKLHKGTQWLTNLGIINIKKELDYSKMLGYFSIEDVSRKLKINKLLILEIFNLYMDNRVGIFDNSGEKFYYSMFINERIDKIKSLPESEEQIREVNRLAKELNIDKTQIQSKIDENLELLGEEIKQSDQISIKDYMNKVGMNIDNFMNFIDDLGIMYLKKGDILIFNQNKIEDAKKDIKLMLKSKSNSEDQIDLTNFEIKPKIIEELLIELVTQKEIRGIFFTEEDKLTFYTERGIRNLMLENRTMFSFYDFFYGKELTEEDLVIIHSIFDDLLKTQQIKGTFNEDTLTFFSSEVVFAQDYNTILDEFEKIVNKYIEIFNTEFKKIKKILIKKNQTIFPQEIKRIQETMDSINQKYVLWRSGIEAYVKNANNNLLKKQGLSLKKYKVIKNSTMKKDDIKVFEEDPDVIDLITSFNKWVKLFNNLEIKYGNVIFYQKRLLQDPEDQNNLDKLNDLLEELDMKD